MADVNNPLLRMYEELDYEDTKLSRTHTPSDFVEDDEDDELPALEDLPALERKPKKFLPMQESKEMAELWKEKNKALSKETFDSYAHDGNNEEYYTRQRLERDRILREEQDYADALLHRKKNGRGKGTLHDGLEDSFSRRGTGRGQDEDVALPPLSSGVDKRGVQNDDTAFCSHGEDRDFREDSSSLEDDLGAKVDLEADNETAVSPNFDEVKIVRAPWEIDDDEEDEDDFPFTSTSTISGDNESSSESDGGADFDAEELVRKAELLDSNSTFMNEEYDEEEMEEARLLELFNVDALLGRAINMGASDLDIIPGDYVSVSRLDKMERITSIEPFPSGLSSYILDSVASHIAIDSYFDNFNLDTSYTLQTGEHMGRRVRVNVAKSGGETTFVFRIIADSIPDISEIGVSDEVLEWTNLSQGVCIIAGATGSGKSTTFASLIDHVRKNQQKKIVTLEKPVEYLFPKLDGKSKSVIVQREVGDGADVRTFEEGIVAAMRQHPNIILVGEIRSPEETSQLLIAAESGHATFTTMHAKSVEGVVSKLKMMYTGAERSSVLANLEQSLSGVASQVLVVSPDGNSRSMVQSVLSTNDEVAELIGAGDAMGIRNYMRRNKSTMEHELVRAAYRGQCTMEEARRKSAQPKYFDQLLADGFRS